MSTETVTLALQGRVAHLGNDPWHPVLFSAATARRPLCRLTQARAQGWVEVELQLPEIADLRDILNALKEREEQKNVCNVESCCPKCASAKIHRVKDPRDLTPGTKWQCCACGYEWHMPLDGTVPTQ